YLGGGPSRGAGVGQQFAVFTQFAQQALAPVGAGVRRGRGRGWFLTRNEIGEVGEQVGGRQAALHQHGLSGPGGDEGGKQFGRMDRPTRGQPAQHLFEVVIDAGGAGLLGERFRLGEVRGKLGEARHVLERRLVKQRIEQRRHVEPLSFGQGAL